MNHPEAHIFGMTADELREWCETLGMPSFRAKQIGNWIYEQQEPDPERWSNLSKRDRDLVRNHLVIESGTRVAHQIATDGTQKLLIDWTDPGRATDTVLPVLNASSDSSSQTECVMIPSLDQTTRKTACISSQVGCPVGCRFCASGLEGLAGNLSAGRIVEQAWRLGRLPDVGRISNIVFMGMGEPLSNFSQVTRAARILATPAPFGLGIGARRITISTVGLPKYIERLADEFELPVTLALSLHAPDDDLRRQLIPWAEYTSIDELLAACSKWFERTGREITLEYTLLGGTNDSPQQAARLAEVAKQLRANINLIRYNEVDGLPFRRPKDQDVRSFQTILRDRGINVHIRASRGRDIAAACGQLRREHAEESA